MKTVELARRYQLLANDAEAFYDIRDDSVILEYGGAPFDPAKAGRFQKMLEALGCDKSHRLIADRAGEIESALELAIKRAPRLRDL